MSEELDFEVERDQAGLEWSRCAPLFAELGITLVSVDIERASLSTSIEVENDGHRLSIGSLREPGAYTTAENILNRVRQHVAISIAWQSLKHKGQSRSIHVTPLIRVKSTASFLAEVFFDYDQLRFALVAEYLEPISEPPGFRRVWRLHQAHPQASCDMPRCDLPWELRRSTSTNDYIICLCKSHRNVDPDVLLRQVQGSLFLGERVVL